MLNGVMDLFYVILGSGKLYYLVCGCHYLLEQVTELKVHVLNSDFAVNRSDNFQRKVKS